MALVGASGRETSALPLTPGSNAMDLDSLLQRHRLSLMKADAPLTPREQRAHDQFARDYAERAGLVRDAIGHRPDASRSTK